jgi:hypothetical protein
MSLPDPIVPHPHGFSFGIGVDAALAAPRRTVVVGEPTGAVHAQDLKDHLLTVLSDFFPSEL